LENCFKANVRNLGTQIFVKHNVGCFDVTTNNAKEVHFVMKIENAMSNPHTFSSWPIHFVVPFAPYFQQRKVNGQNFKITTY
jgi:hypothetical protein